MAVSKCPCSTFSNAMFNRWQDLIGSYASTHSTFTLLGSCNKHPNIQSHKIQSHKDTYAHTISQFFLNQLNFSVEIWTLMRLSKRQKKVWRQKLVEKKIMQKQCRPVYLSMNKVCIHFCLLYLHLKENGKTVAKCLWRDFSFITACCFKVQHCLTGLFLLLLVSKVLNVFVCCSLFDFCFYNFLTLTSEKSEW